MAGSAGAGDIDCTGTEPATLVPLPDGYSIDATEVTRCQYQVWLAVNPNPSTQALPECSWNTDFAAGEGCMGHGAVCQGAGCGSHPQVCVDWCDAYAYCKGVSKRLCGKIGGGANGFDDFADATKSQWYTACSAGGLHNFPYGGSAEIGELDGYEPQTCNGKDNDATGCGHGACTTVGVGTLKGCESKDSGYAGVYDLSGNVWEWEDSCSGTGNNDQCRMRGGAFDPSLHLSCGIGSSVYYRSGAGPNFGFRCCSDP